MQKAGNKRTVYDGNKWVFNIDLNCPVVMADLMSRGPALAAAMWNLFTTTDGVAVSGNGKTVTVRRRVQGAYRNMDGEVVRDVIWSHVLHEFENIQKDLKK